MAPTLRQNNEYSATTVSNTGSLQMTGGNLAANSLIRVLVAFNGTKNVSSISDTFSLTWVQAASSQVTGKYIEEWYALNPTARSSTEFITVFFSGSDSVYVEIEEWLGLARSSPVNVTASHGAVAGTTFSSGTTASALAGGLACASICGGCSSTADSWTTGSPFTSIGGHNGTASLPTLGLSRLNGVSAGTQSETWTATTGGAAGNAIIVVYSAFVTAISAAETLTSSDTVNRSATGVRSSAETIRTSDSPTSSRLFLLGTKDELPGIFLPGVAAQTTTGTGGANRILGANRQATSTSALIDLVAAVKNGGTKIAAAVESLFVNDQTARSASFFRQAIETLTALDVIVAAKNGGTKVVSAIESLFTSESLGTTRLFLVGAKDERSGLFMPGVALQTVTTGGGANRILGANRQATGTSILADIINAIRTGGGTKIAAAIESLFTSDSPGTVRLFLIGTKDARPGVLIPGIALQTVATVGGGVNRILGAIRSALGTSSSADTASRGATTSRSVADTTISTGLTGRTVGFFRQVVDTLTSSDIVAAIRTSGGTKIAAAIESLFAIDSSTRQATLVRRNTEALTALDSGTAARLKIIIALESVLSADAPLRQILFGRSSIEALAATDTTSRAVVVGRAAAETIVTTDTAARRVGFVRQIIEALSETDTTAAARNSTFKYAAAIESLFSSDTLSRSVAAGRQTSESITAADTSTRSGSFLRQLVEVLTGTDAVSRSARMARQIAELTVLSDAPTRTASLSRFVTDTDTNTDTATRSTSLTRQLIDALTTTDSATRQQGLLRQVAEVVTNADTVSRNGIKLIAALESTVSLDNITRQVSNARLALGSIGGADVAALTQSLSRSDTESLASTDQVTRATVFARLVADFTATTDSLARLAGITRLVTDTSAEADVNTRTYGAVRQDAETGTVTDVSTRSATYSRTVNDAIFEADTANRQAGFFRAIAEAIGLSDLIADLWRKPAYRITGQMSTTTTVTATLTYIITS